MHEISGVDVHGVGEQTNGEPTQREHIKCVFNDMLYITIVVYFHVFGCVAKVQNFFCCRLMHFLPDGSQSAHEEVQDERPYISDLL